MGHGLAVAVAHVPAAAGGAWAPGGGHGHLWGGESTMGRWMDIDSMDGGGGRVVLLLHLHPCCRYPSIFPSYHLLPTGVRAPPRRPCPPRGCPCPTSPPSPSMLSIPIHLHIVPSLHRCPCPPPRRPCRPPRRAGRPRPRPPRSPPPARARPRPPAPAPPACPSSRSSSTASWAR